MATPDQHPNVPQSFQDWAFDVMAELCLWIRNLLRSNNAFVMIGPCQGNFCVWFISFAWHICGTQYVMQLPISARFSHIVSKVNTDPRMFLNVLEFDKYIKVPLNVLELMTSSVLENIISTMLYISPKFWPYQLPMIFILFCTCELFFWFIYSIILEVLKSRRLQLIIF